MTNKTKIICPWRAIFLVCVTLLLTIVSPAQKQWTAYGGIGPINYFGDLQDKQLTTTDMHLGATLGITRQFSPHFLTNFSIMYGKLSANDAHNGPKWDGRNLNFQTSIFETALTGEFDLINIAEPDDGNLIDNNPKKFTPYVFLGIGAFNFNPYTYDIAGKRVNLRPLGTEGQQKPYSSWQISIPMGIGVKYAITSTVQLSAEFNLRKTLTDYLDDVSQHQYIDTVQLLQTNGPEAASLSYRADEIPNNDYKFYGYRGNPGRKDGYYSLLFKVAVQLFVYKPQFYYGY